MVYRISFRVKDYYSKTIIVDAPSAPRAHFFQPTSMGQWAYYITKQSAEDLLSDLQKAYPDYFFRLIETVSSDNHYSAPFSVVVVAPD